MHFVYISRFVAQLTNTIDHSAQMRKNNSIDQWPKLRDTW